LHDKWELAPKEEENNWILQNKPKQMKKTHNKYTKTQFSNSRFKYASKRFPVTPSIVSSTGRM
jgi:hypothetical protein